MGISIIAAVGKEREIGINGQLPWHLSDDLKRFKELTTGEVVVMGRKTFDSIGKPLSNRENFILSKDPDFNPPEGAIKAGSFEEALKLAPEGKEIFFIGGEKVFAEALKKATRLHITFVDIVVPKADTHFPEFNLQEWKAVSVTPVPANEKNPFSSTYVVYERK